MVTRAVAGGMFSERDAHSGARLDWTLFTRKFALERRKRVRRWGLAAAGLLRHGNAT